MGMTVKESGGLILISLAAFVVMFVTKMALPLRDQPLLGIGAIVFIVLIYMRVPSGRGSLDFKVGLIVGCVMTTLVYELLSQVMPILLRSFR